MSLIELLKIIYVLALEKTTPNVSL